MSEQKKTVYLITGASRGIAEAMLPALLSRPNHTIILAGRSEAALANFAKLEHDASSRVIPIHIDAASDEDVARAVPYLRSQGVESIDVVIAAAGIVTALERIKEADMKTVIEHVDVNCGGVIRLIKGLWDMIGGDDSAESNKFVVLSSSCGSIQEMEPVPVLAYGISKAAVNYVLRKLHDEWKGCAVAVHPGWVRTQMGDYSAKAWGFPQAPLTTQESADAVLKLVDGFSREKDGGKFISYDGTSIAW